MKTTSIVLSVFALLSFLVGACGSSTGDQVRDYFSKQEADTLLVNIVTYMDAYAPAASNTTRFEPKFREYYRKKAEKYRIVRYTITPDSTHHFFLIRPVGGGQLFQRGVGGRFKLNEGSLMPSDFEEMWCTPHLKEVPVIEERGSYLFREMVKKGTVDHLLDMKHFIEWPDSTLVYDKSLHEWVSRK